MLRIYFLRILFAVKFPYKHSKFWADMSIYPECNAWRHIFAYRRFHSGGLGIATNKIADVQPVSAAVIVAIICKRRKKKRKVKKVLGREWLGRRTERGAYRQLLEEFPARF